MTSISDRTGVRQSLCCECGNLRTVSAKASERNGTGPWGASPDQIAEALQRTRCVSARQYWERQRPYERALEDLKCATCGKVTQHAMVAPATSPGGAYRDRAEEENLGAAARAASPGPVAADPFAVVESLGIQLIEVPDLDRPVIYVNTHSIALVRAGMDADRRQSVGEWLLREVVEGGAR